MNYITIFERVWGNLLLDVRFNSVDFLPRVTMTAIDHAFIFNIGFLMLSLNLTLWDKQIRDFNKKCKVSRSNSLAISPKWPL